MSVCAWLWFGLWAWFIYSNSQVALHIRTLVYNRKVAFAFSSQFCDCNDWMNVRAV